MPEVSIEVAGRVYRVGCGEGEEPHLIKLAELIDAEASRLSRKMGQMTEGRLMLMSALMLADKLADSDGGVANEEMQLKLTEAQSAALEFEAKAAEAEARALEAEAKLAEAGEISGSDQQRITDLEGRAGAAEAKLAAVTDLGAKAEERATHAENQWNDAKEQLAAADARAAEAEAKVAEAMQRAANAEKLAQTPAQPSDLFNPEREEEVAQSLDALAERIEALAGRVEMPA